MHTYPPLVVRKMASMQGSTPDWNLSFSTKISFSNKILGVWIVPISSLPHLCSKLIVLNLSFIVSCQRNPIKKYSMYFTELHYPLQIQCFQNAWFDWKTAVHFMNLKLQHHVTECYNIKENCSSFRAYHLFFPFSCSLENQWKRFTFLPPLSDPRYLEEDRSTYERKEENVVKTRFFLFVLAQSIPSGRDIANSFPPCVEHRKMINYTMFHNSCHPP